MTRCNKYGVAWHTDLSSYFLDDVFVSSDKYQEAYKKEISKLNYLKDKLIEVLNSTSDKVLFVYKSNTGKFDYIEKFITLIEKKYLKLKFKVLVVKIEAQKINFAHNKLDIENVRFLAPPQDTMVGGDNKGWNKIFSKYISVPTYEQIAFKTFKQNGVEIADYLREISLTFEDIGDIKTAYKLMLQARNCRPLGPYINQKIEEYEKKLEIKVD